MRRTGAVAAAVMLMAGTTGAEAPVRPWTGFFVGAGLGAGMMMAQTMMNSMKPPGGEAPAAPAAPTAPAGGAAPQTPTGETKFCMECGQKIARSAKFCPECGKAQG